MKQLNEGQKDLLRGYISEFYRNGSVTVLDIWFETVSELLNEDELIAFETERLDKDYVLFSLA